MPALADAGPNHVSKAREQMKGSGSAMLRWFNTASLSEAKSPLETMHIAFRLPCFLCSRESKRMSVRLQMRRVRSVDADQTCAESVVSLLLDFGYARELAGLAVAVCGPDIHAAPDFCSGPTGFGGPSAGADAAVARKR